MCLAQGHNKQTCRPILTLFLYNFATFRLLA